MTKIAQPVIGPEEIRAVEGVLRSCMLSQDKVVAEFERRFADFCGAKYAVAVSSGTAALHTALAVCGISDDDEVITTPFTFVATANSVLMQGARPVFCDIEPTTFNINPAEIEKKITKRTKAILAVDLFGHIYDVGAIKKIASKYKLKIIEDACQAHGAEYKNKKAGIFGDIGCFSFYATKNMMTGEGGMLVTNNKKYADLARRFRHHGQDEKVRYQYLALGCNYRLTEMAAAIGLEQLKKLKSFNQKRIRNAKMLTEGLKDIKGLIVPTIKRGYNHVFHQYTVRITDDFKMSRDKLVDYLKERGVASAVFYPKPLHLYPHFYQLGYKRGDFPVAEKVSREVLSLPCHPLVSAKDIRFIIKTIKESSL